MPYLGQNLQVANTLYRLIDDISSGFNGVAKSFALKVNGLTPIPFPVNEQNCIIVVNGVPQKPDLTGAEGFKFTGSNIVFSSAPTAGQKFWGVILAGADYVAAGVTYPNGTVTTPSITFGSNTSTGLYLVSNNVLGIATGGANAITVDSSQRVGINNATPTAPLDVVGTVKTSSTIVAGGDVTLPSINGGPLSGTRNRIMNGQMAVDQRNAGAAQTFTAAAALAYAVDRWYGYCTGANVTGQRVAGATAGQYRYQFTGAASVTAMGFGQRIEQLNSTDLAGTTATLSVDLANSVLTSVTWTAYYATTADTFGTLASPTRTQIATGTFTVTSTVTRYNTQISIPAAATTGIEIVFTVGAQTSGTWIIGNVQLEAGTVATPFERRSYGQELALCQRYYQKTSAVWVVENSGVYQVKHHPITMRATPTAAGGGAGYSYTGDGNVLVEAQTTRALQNLTYSAEL